MLPIQEHQIKLLSSVLKMVSKENYNQGQQSEAISNLPLDKKTQYRDDYYATWRSGLVIGTLALEANNLSLVNNSVFLVDFLAIAVGMKGPFRIPPKHTQFQRHLER